MVQVHSNTHTAGLLKNKLIPLRFAWETDRQPVLPARLSFIGLAQLAGRRPEINGLAALQRQGYGLFPARIWFKSHGLGRVTRGEVRIGDKRLIHFPSPRIGSFIDRGTGLAPYHDRTRCGSIPIPLRPAAMQSGNGPASHPSRPPLGESPF